jgi:hypothetical protein
MSNSNIPVDECAIESFQFVKEKQPHITAINNILFPFRLLKLYKLKLKLHKINSCTNEVNWMRRTELFIDYGTEKVWTYLHNFNCVKCSTRHELLSWFPLLILQYRVNSGIIWRMYPYIQWFSLILNPVMLDLPVKLNNLKVVLRLEHRTLCVKTIGYVKHRLTRTLWGCRLGFRISENHYSFNIHQSRFLIKT